jgi:subtilisin family serine protease
MKRTWVLALLLAVCPESVQAIKVEKLSAASHPGLRGLAAAPGASIEVVAEQAMVHFSTSASAAARAAALAAVGMGVIQELRGVGWTLVSLPSGMRVVSGLSVLRGLPGVLSVEPNNVYRLARIPSDPLFSSQWALDLINAPGGWEYEVGESCTTTIAVIDAGLDVSHNDLSGKMAGLDHRYCHPTAPADDCVNEVPQVACNHGTRVAGVAAATANNGIQVAGVSWGAKLLAMRVFRTTDCNLDCSDNGANVCGTDDPGIIEALEYLLTRQNTAPYGKIIVNMSLGPYNPTCSPFAACSGAMATAITNAVNAGIPVVVASGNNGCSSVGAPANCAGVVGSGVIPVGATDSSNAIATFSNGGTELSSYGVVAPGVSVLTTNLSNGTVNATGTSFAAPHVAGLAALILAAKPTFTAAQVQNAIRGGADLIGVATLGVSSVRPAGAFAGAGRINAFRSMRLAVKGTLADFEGDQKAIAFPNPFRVSQNPLVSITVPTSLQGANTKIKLYTISGEFVKELTGLTWDGKNKDGNLVATGTYVFVVSTENGSTRGRVAVIR